MAEPPDDSRNLGSRTGKHGARMAGTSCRNMDGSPAPMFPEEEYLPGRTENLHDYLLPSAGDVPGIECLLVEDPEPLGPYGAKGIGEPALIPTAPAILNAVHHAAGVRLRRLPILPHRVRAALEAGGRHG